MDPIQQIGKAILIFGVVLVVVGGLLYWGKGVGPFGKLPGDIRIERPNFNFYFPITSCLIISVVLSVIFYIFSKLR